MQNSGVWCRVGVLLKSSILSSWGTACRIRGAVQGWGALCGVEGRWAQWGRLVESPRP